MNSQGFTLIELIIVITIISVSVALAVSTLGHNVVNSKIRHTAEGIMDAIIYSKSEAAKRTEIVILTIENNGSYHVDVPVDNVVQRIKTVTGANNLQIKSTDDNGADTILRISPRGRLSESLTLTVQPSTGSCDDYNCLRVEINQNGSVRLCNPNAAAEVLQCNG